VNDITIINDPPAEETTDEHLKIVAHVSDLFLSAMGCEPSLIRAWAHDRSIPQHGRSEEALHLVETVALRVLPHLLAFRELVEAAEAAGLGEEMTDKRGSLLDRARDAHAALTGWSN
jgi:hypothetical protein